MRTFFMLACCFSMILCNDEVKVKDVKLEMDTSIKNEEPPVPPPIDTINRVTKNQPRATDNEHWKKKKAEGVDFMVIGNEPFWNLEIRNNKSLRFHLSDWEQPVNIEFAGSVEKSRFNELSARDIEVRIEPKECSDGMSDYWYDYSVTVIYKGKTYNGCGISL